MAKTLEAHDKLIREIFEGSYQFEIPDYQRPYAWTTEQAGELFDDLMSSMQDARVSGATSQYFLGSIVLIKNDREPKSSVVDGQQRLAQDKAYQNAQANSDKQNAKLEHDKALNRVVLELLSDHTELFKQFSDNPNFKRWLTDTVFDATYHRGAMPPKAPPQAGASA